MLFLDAIELLIKNMETIGRSSATIKLYRRDLRRFATTLLVNKTARCTWKT